MCLLCKKDEDEEEEGDGRGSWQSAWRGLLKGVERRKAERGRGLGWKGKEGGRRKKKGERKMKSWGKQTEETREDGEWQAVVGGGEDEAEERMLDGHMADGADVFVERG
ncbi:uncharacterized protein MONOS_17170 [Monocercomonoides exilis]|uniref:uncharacterized protein n=1 Tax=Monocercomonoides exilis TaxID=2049356 RepID=UPI00355AC120|nr:hypothetical protein MONOS_17170 [Monocercomonoides exilis]